MIVFLSCVSEKNDHKCAAKDLYISPLFQKSYAYAQKLNPDKIYILSAKYFLLDLDDQVSPYDLTLKDMSTDERRQWTEKVIEMSKKKGIKQDDEVIFLAGKTYTEYLTEYFTNYSIPYQDNGLEGLGYILQWLDEQIGIELASQIDMRYESQIKEIKENKYRAEMNSKLLKLARIVLKLAEVVTDKATLIYEGELVEGVEVFIEKEGEIVPAEDGEYVAEDGKIIVVAEGKVAEVKEAVVEDPAVEKMEEETPVEEPNQEVEDLKAKVAELEAIIAEKDAEIEALKGELETKEEALTTAQSQLKMSVETPITKKNKNNVTNKALKYFSQC